MRIFLKHIVVLCAFFSTTMHGAASSQPSFPASVVKRKSEDIVMALARQFPDFDEIASVFEGAPIELVAAALSPHTIKRHSQIGKMIQAYFSRPTRIKRNGGWVNVAEEAEAYSEKITQLCEHINFDGWHTIRAQNIILKDRWVASAANQFVVTSDLQGLRETAYQLMFGTAAGSHEEDLRRFALAEQFLQHFTEEHLMAARSWAMGKVPFIEDYLIKKISVEAEKDKPNFVALQAVLNRLGEPAFNDIIKILQTHEAKSALWILATAEKLPALSITGDPRMAVLYQAGKAFHDRITTLGDLAGCGAKILVNAGWFDDTKVMARSVNAIYIGLILAAADKRIPAADGKSDIPLVFEILRSGYLHNEITKGSKYSILRAFEEIVCRHVIKPNVPIFFDDSDATTFFAACIMNRCGFIGNIEEIDEARDSYPRLFSLLDADEFNMELRALQVLPAFKTFVQNISEKDWLKLASSSYERVRSLGIVAGNAQRLQPTLFERLAGHIQREECVSIEPEDKK